MYEIILGIPIFVVNLWIALNTAKMPSQAVLSGFLKK